jgi:hypothetical protein
MHLSGQLHASAAFPPEEKFAGIHWIGSGMGPTAGLNDMEWRKISFYCRESNPCSPACSPSPYRLISVHYYYYYYYYYYYLFVLK